jgi:hypothetical protein
MSFYNANLSHDGINETRRRYVEGRIPDLHAFWRHRHSLGSAREQGVLKKGAFYQGQLPVWSILYRNLLSALFDQIY